jgi:hypothetical protein
VFNQDALVDLELVSKEIASCVRVVTKLQKMVEVVLFNLLHVDQDNIEIVITNV